MLGDLTFMAIVAISLSMIPQVASFAHEKSLMLRSTSGISSQAYYNLDTFPPWFLDGVLPKDESCNFIVQQNDQRKFIFPVCRHAPNLYDSWIAAEPEPESKWAGKTGNSKGTTAKPPPAAPPASIGDSLRDAWGDVLYLIETTAFKGDITPSVKNVTAVVEQGKVYKIDWARLAQEEVKKELVNADEL
ncbi:hypothetical protein QFC22_002912 [Naganishia vaughanmartiniae]|uniref:Uncharacterized protein n=1 Tax=Naganishia vaughanmartiniae TaxID=1424756 RepID=A0ACC2X9F4_9TREE|nr:hypothetical protein QFC22_002912 [Naganishia vaughanmartiniae]